MSRYRVFHRTARNNNLRWNPQSPTQNKQLEQIQKQIQQNQSSEKERNYRRDQEIEELKVERKEEELEEIRQCIKSAEEKAVERENRIDTKLDSITNTLLMAINKNLNLQGPGDNRRTKTRNERDQGSDNETTEHIGSPSKARRTESQSTPKKKKVQSTPQYGLENSVMDEDT